MSALVRVSTQITKTKTECATYRRPPSMQEVINPDVTRPIGTLVEPPSHIDSVTTDTPESCPSLSAACKRQCGLPNVTVKEDALARAVSVARHPARRCA